MFIGFANFYWRFIQGFIRIAASLTFLLKTTESLELAPKAFRANDNEVFGDGDGTANETVVNLSKNEIFRKSTHMPNIKATGKSNFLTSDAKKVFNHLQLAFIKSPILRHFDLESHIRIETDVSSHAIDRVSSQLNLDFYAPLN